MAIKFLNTVAVDTDVLYVDASSNRVGIGTTSPSQKLEINGAVLAGDYRGSTNVYLTSPDSWIFRSTGGNERMRITSAGNVGIGTTNPQEKLHVYNAGVARIEIEGTNDSTAFKATNNAGSYGWYVPGANNSFRLFNFGTGSDLVTVNASGNVGIGTTSPSSLLHEKGADPVLTIQDTSTITTNASSTLRLGESGAGGVLDVYWDIKQASDSLNTHLEINHSSNGNHFTILDGGNVGIGTTSPSYKLDVRGDIGTDRYIRHTGDTNTYFGFSDPDTIQFNTAGSERLRINSSGNVGIGTTSPSSLLHLQSASSPALQIKDTTNNVTFKAYAQDSNSHSKHQ